MYNASLLKSGLIGLIGWRQNIDPAGTQLTTLTTSSSGLYFNDEHPLLTFDNLESIAPKFDDITSPTETFTDWLQSKTEGSIIRAIDKWINKKFKVKTARNLLERSQLYYTTGSQNDIITMGSAICGLSVQPVRSRNITTTIEQVGVQFDTNQTITIRLFDATLDAEVDNVAITYTGSGGVQWETVDWTVDGNAAYYIVYDQATITGNAINGVYDYTINSNGISDGLFNNYFLASPFEVVGSTSSLWNIENNSYTTSQNYGLNLRLNVQCDYTNFILEQKELFKTIIGKQVAIDLLREIAYNPNIRTNRNESNVSTKQVLYEIDGDSQGKEGGLYHQLENAIDSLTFDFDGIDKVCLPCRKYSVRFKAI